MFKRNHRATAGRRAMPAAVVALVIATTMLVPASPVLGLTSITVGTAQPVYLVNNGDTANIGLSLTLAGGTTLDRDMTVTVNTGTALQVGGAVGSTTLAGGTTIAGGSTTLTAGSTTLGLPAALGDSAIKVPSVTNFLAGQSVAIDTGANLETAVIASVGTAGASTVRVATSAGATTIQVVSTTGFANGTTITVGAGASLESAIVQSTSTSGGNPRVVVTAPLTQAHAVGEQISGSGITLTAPLTIAHASGATVATASPAGVSTVRVGSVTNFAAGQTVNVDTGASLETATIAGVGAGGSTTLSIAAAAGDTRLRIASVSGLVAGNTVWIDGGTNVESATIASVGSGGSTTLAAAATVGDTNIKVASTTGLTPNATIIVDTGAGLETAQIYQVGGSGASGTGVNLYAPLTMAHPSGTAVTGNGITLATPLAGAHGAGVPVSGLTLTFSAPLAMSHAGAATVATLTPVGATNIKVASVVDFAPGQAIVIDPTGASPETVTIASVGTAGPAGTGIDLTAPLTIARTGAPTVRVPTSAAIGDSTIKIAHIVGFYVGDTITIDTSTNQEVRTITSIGTPTFLGTGIGLSAPLTIAHNAGVTVTDTRVLASTAVEGVDYTLASHTITIPTGTPSGTVVTLPIVTLPNATPSVAKTINTTITCTSGCATPTPTLTYNNDPTTVVINAHGFPYLDSGLPVATRVADLMSRMSLFEKAGQMDETLLGVSSNGSTTNSNSWNNTRAWALGSILSGGTDSPVPNSPTGWADLIDNYEYRALATPLQIPIVYGIDTIHGNSHMIGTVLFPHDIGMGATRNPDLAYQQGLITAQETRSAGPQWGFGPTICVDRDIRWGRTYECFGEDPTLVSMMETIIDGIQGVGSLGKDNAIMASSKHFAGDGATQFGRNASINVMSSAEFARVALAPYTPAVQVHDTATIMPSYSSPQLDGAAAPTLMSAYGDLMNGWLKGTTGFEGFLISDYNAINSIPVPTPNPLPAGLNNNYAYQVMTSFNAGMDMVMAPSNPDFKNFVNYVQELVRTGNMTQARVDDAVRRILTQKFEYGLFDHPFTDRSTQSQIGSPERRAIAREATAESQVLLKNADNFLPLSKTAKIYLAGSSADNVSNQLGGWSIGWQSIPAGDIPAQAATMTTIRQALTNVVGSGNITYSATVPTPPAAGTYDVGVVVVGETAYAEGSGDAPSQTDAPTTADATAINNVCSVMPCVILSMAGRPFMLNDAQFNLAKAVVGTWIGFTEAQGVADVLFGDLPFTGRLSMTWPTTLAQEPINVGDASYNPRFPFGWGLRTGTGFSTKSSLIATRDSLATITGDAHVTAAIADLDAAIAAPVWNADGSAMLGAQIDWWLQQAANELAQTTAASFKQEDGVVSAARDIAQAVVVASGGPNAITSPLIGDSDVALLNGHPDVAVQKLAQIAGTTSTTLTADFDPTRTASPVTFTATVTTGDPGVTGVPDGDVQFSLDGSPVGGPVALDAAGHATWTTSTLALGTHVVAAAYAGHNVFLPSTSAPLNHTVKKRLATTTAVTSDIAPSIYGTLVTFSATVSPENLSLGSPPTGFVQWKVDGVALGGPSPLAGGVATLALDDLRAGTRSIRAVYLADPNYTGSTSPAYSQQVKKATPTGAAPVSSLGNSITFGDRPTFTATFVNPVAPLGSLAPANVQFMVDGTNMGAPVALVGTPTGGTAAFSVTWNLPTGTHTIKARYLGNASFAAFTTPGLSLTIH